MQDVPASVSLACSRCGAMYAVEDGLVSPDVMAAVHYPLGRSWFPLCPSCSAFYLVRAGVPGGG